MGICITCDAYYQKETADGMIRKCKLDGTTVYPNSSCRAYKPCEPHEKANKEAKAESPCRK